MNFAIIENNIVTNLIVADTLEIAEAVSGLTCVQYTDVHSIGIGWTYADGVFIAPTFAE